MSRPTLYEIELERIKAEEGLCSDQTVQAARILRDRQWMRSRGRSSIDVNADREREWARAIASLDAQYREVSARRPDLVEAWNASWNKRPDPMAKHPPKLVADSAETDRLMDEAFARFKLHRSPSLYREECQSIIGRPALCDDLLSGRL